ncbi:hypothetical protein RUM43_009883, partial [Polyplax serrata]
RWRFCFHDVEEGKQNDNKEEEDEGRRMNKQRMSLRMTREASGISGWSINPWKSREVAYGYRVGPRTLTPVLHGTEGAPETLVFPGP